MKEPLKNDVLNIIYERCSLRSFSDREISEENKELLFRAAMRAPTAGNLMNYTIIDVTDQAVKRKLAETCDNQPMIAQAPMVLVFLADMQRLYDYFEYSEVPEMCRNNGLSYKTPEEGDLLLAANDAIVAAQNMVIAAESLGMGSCYIGDIIENIETHRELLALPPWTFPVTMLIIGYPRERDNRKTAGRFDAEYIIHTNKYRRFGKNELAKMFDNKDENSGPEMNNGQKIYLRKFAADFMSELRRSFKKGLEEWSNAEKS